MHPLIRMTLGVVIAVPGWHVVRADPTAPSTSRLTSSDTVQICLAPANVEANAGDAAGVVNAVRETFTSFLTGPTLQAKPLTARLQSQVRAEANEAACPYVLFTTVKHERHSGGPGLLRRAAGGAMQAGVYSATGAISSATGQVAASVAAGAVSAAASDFAYSVRAKDELTLSYRLESADGKLALEKTEKRKAKSDGEDLLTPAVQKSAEAIATAVTTPGRGQ